MPEADDYASNCQVVKVAHHFPTTYFVLPATAAEGDKYGKEEKRFKSN